MKTAVIILNWNGAEMLQKFLPSVIHHTPDAKVIVADNGSSDDSIRVLEEKFPSVQIHALDKNYGFAEGYNRAIQAVDCEYVVLLNSDVEVTDGWLNPLINYMDAHRDVAACQPKLLSFYDRGKFEYAGAAGGYIDCFGYPFCRGRVFNEIECDNGQYNTIEEIHWATGACLLVRKNVYMDCGGLDARFFAHNEEIDLCWRMRLYGYKIVCLPGSKVFHLGGGTLPQGNPRKTYLNFRNNLTMLYKNVPEWQLKRIMRWRFVLDYVAVAKYIIGFKISDAKAIVKARHDFYKWKQCYLPIRRNIQNMAKTDDCLVKGYSILWQFYVRGKRRFSELEK